MAVTLDLVSKNSLPALGGNLTFKAPSASQVTKQRIFILNVGMLVNAGLYSLDFTNGAPTNVDYINILDGDGAILDTSYANPSFATTWNFNPSKAFSKIVFVSDNHYINWPANSNAVVSSGLISNTANTPAGITIPTTPAPNLTNCVTSRNIGGTDYLWSYPTYNIATGAYYAGKIVNSTTMAAVDMYSNNHHGTSYTFDYTNNKIYILGGGSYNSVGGIQSHTQTMYTSFIEKDMTTSAFTQTAKSNYPDALNTMNVLMSAPGDGNVYTFGTHYLETSNVPTTHYFGNLAFKWTGATNTWSPIAKMPGEASNSYDRTFTFSYEGKVYISGARKTAVDKGSESTFDFWFGYYNPATNTYTTIKNYKSATKAFDNLGDMLNRTYVEDATHLYDKHGRKYSKAQYIATGFIPAPSYIPQYWAPTPVLSNSYTPGSATQYAQYLDSSNYYFLSQNQTQVSVPAYAARV